MSTSESQYYEHEGFWNEHAFGEPDRERIDRTIRLVPPDVLSVLDVGCGNGLFCNTLAQRRPELRVVGVDRSEAALAKVLTEKHQSAIEALPFPERSFDCVCALQVIEHLPRKEYDAALDGIARTARSWIVISVPYREQLSSNVTQCPECSTIFNVDLHLRSYEREAVQTLLDDRGFRCETAETFGIFQRFVGQNIYHRLFYANKRLAWRSPICPLCGYRDERRDAPPRQPASRNSSLAGRLFATARSLPKTVWPKERFPYWIIARYRRTS